MRTAERSIRPAVLAGLAALLLSAGLLACGGDDSTGASGSVTTTTTTTTSVADSGKALASSNSSGFDPQAIYSDAAPSVVTILSLVGDSVGM